MFIFAFFLYTLAQITATSSFADVVTQLVAWLSGPSFSIAVSQALEMIPRFHQLSSSTKFIVSTVLTALGTCAGYLLGSNPAVNAIPANNPSVAFMLVALAFALTQIYHAWAINKESTKQ